MQKIQLYIEGQRVSMFEDESVTITQSIQNIKDISKVFTDFTQTFSLPADSVNNKIFNHYENNSIVGGFDARKKKSANIELNGLPFKDGKIKLEGVGLKNNKAHSYKITFFGSTVELKDLLGDDNLSALANGLSAYNKTYSPTDIRSSLQLDPTANDVITPLITHTRRLFYDSSDGQHGNTGDGNLFYANEDDHNHGVLWSDLKYAIRLDVIIKAIETTYGIVFSNDFFTNTNEPYYNLFLWLHRKKGDVESPSGLNESIVDGWSNEVDDDTATSISNTSLTVNGNPLKYKAHSITFYTASSDDYIVSLLKDGLEVYNSGTTSGNLVIGDNDFDLERGNYTTYISSSASVTFSSIDWFVVYRPDSSQELYEKKYSTGAYAHVNNFVFDITQQIPEIKVIDFITGVFKTFNLTAFVDKNTKEIVVKTLDSFYADGNSFEITKYVVPSVSSVDSALPFRQINLKHKSTKTFLAAIHNQLFGKEWATIEYKNGEKLDGGIYNVETCFSHLKYERLYNVNNGAATTIQYGYFVDDNQEPFYSEPLLFYPVKQTSGTAINFRTSEISYSSVTNYNVPSNSLSLSSSTSKANINFFNELNEYQTVLPNDFTDTLFEVYYKNYIAGVFNESNRITKLTAYLPLNIMLNYTLADRFEISGKSYKINSIKTNLKSGKSELELLNDI